MSRLHDLNFFVKLGAAFALMIVAWLAPDWRWGIPFAALVLALLWVTRVPKLGGYLKGAGLLTLMVIVSWMINLLLQGVAPHTAELTSCCQPTFEIDQLLHFRILIQNYE